MKPGPVQASVIRLLTELPKDARQSTTASIALALARSLDERPMATTARELRDTLLALTDSAPVADHVDELLERRRSRGA